jgi:aerobic-type carbon monoxide dehydrogenase small subunit (CoxS/CutS family)
MTVNGRAGVVEVAAGTSLLEVLRDELGLLGAKDGCGEGQCGACAVLVGGEARASCALPIEAVGARPIVTIEGLAAGGPSPLQDAFVAEGAMQCGYCTGGMLIAATALLARTPAPSDDEIRVALDGQLCRCGAYGRVIRAVRRAASAGGSR